MNVIVISLPIIIMVVLCKSHAAPHKSEFVRDELDSVPLFGTHDSPIQLGMLPEDDEEGHLFHHKYSASATLMMGAEDGGGGGGTRGVEHHQHPDQLPENTDLGKRHRQKQIRYLLRTKTGKWEELQRTGYDADSRGRWHPNGTVKVLIHGYSPPVFAKRELSIRKMHIFEIGDAYGAISEQNNYNVIIVDWTSLSTEPLHKYYEAAISTAYAGEDVAEFLRRLKSLRLISSWENVHLVGFSLGAHVAGIVGALIHRANGGPIKIGRITGIDPAGPLFEQSSSVLGNVTRALNKADANFVDVIHCNMGSLLTYAFARGKFGTMVQSGHADFYPDGGESQKNCTELQDQLEACSHIKCPLLFAQSISNYLLSCPCQSWESFKGGKCPCWRGDGLETAMGERCAKRASGKYYRFM